jgi:hypothetical protein
LVFETDKLGISWDGTFKKNNCPNGVYVWTLSFKKNRSFERETKLSGDVTLIR